MEMNMGPDQVPDQGQDSMIQDQDQESMTQDQGQGQDPGTWVQDPRDPRRYGVAPVSQEDHAQDFQQAAYLNGSDPLRHRSLKALVDAFRQQDPCALLPEILVLDPARRSYFMLNKLAGFVADTDHEQLPREQDLDMHYDKRQFFMCSGLFRRPEHAPYAQDWELISYQAPPQFAEIDLQIVSEDTHVTRKGARFHIHHQLHALDRVTKSLLALCPNRSFVCTPPHIQLLGLYYVETDESLQDEAFYQERLRLLHGLQEGRFAAHRLPAPGVTGQTPVFHECTRMHGDNQQTLGRVIQSLDGVLLEQFFHDTVLLHPETGQPLDREQGESQDVPIQSREHIQQRLVHEMMTRSMLEQQQQAREAGTDGFRSTAIGEPSLAARRPRPETDDGVDPAIRTALEPEQPLSSSVTNISRPRLQGQRRQPIGSLTALSTEEGNSKMEE